MTFLRSILVLALIAAALPAGADEDFSDRVTLQRDDSGSRMTLSGRVVDFTGQSIRLLLRSGPPERTFPAEQVVEVETPQTAGHRQGLKRMADGDYAAARGELESALQEESRGWVRREILSLLVRCAMQEGNHALAGSYFLLLAASDPHTRAVRWIPLCWTEAPPEPALKAEARQWQSDAGDYARLLAASVLLTDPASSAQAEEDLRKLTVSGRTPALRKLAEAQLWRLRVRTASLRPEELRRWETEIEKMPVEIRGGPYYVLGQARLHLRESAHAAAALLWVLLAYDHDPRLAARAGLDAAKALQATGRRDEAVTLYREVAERFRQTPSAAEALAALTALNKDEPAPTP